MEYNKVLSTINSVNSAPKFGFYHIYIELDSKYRDRSNEKDNEFKFKVLGNKNFNIGINSGNLGFTEPLNNMVQLDVGEIIMPNILSYNNISSSKRITMLIHELTSNHVTIKTSTNTIENNNMHFMFDIYPIQIYPGLDPNYRDIGLDTKYIKLVPINRTIIFKTPTSENLDDLTVSFYCDNKKLLFPKDVYTCDIQLGPNIVNNITFKDDHNLTPGDTFEIYFNQVDEFYLDSVKNDIDFYEFKSIEDINDNKVYNTETIKYYNLTNNDEYVTFNPNYLNYKYLLNNKIIIINNVKNSRNVNFLLDSNKYFTNDDTYISNEINNIIDDINLIKENNNILTNNNILLKNNINDYDMIINGLNNEILNLKYNLFKLTNKNNETAIDVHLSHKDFLIANGIKFNNMICYKGNYYNYNLEDESNLEGFNENMIVLRDDIIKLIIENKEIDIELNINNFIQRDYEFIQNNEYILNINDDSFDNFSIILIPTDNNSRIESIRYNIIASSEKYTINNDSYYYNDFTFPIKYYVKKHDKNNNFYVTEDSVIKQYGNISYYNLIEGNYSPIKNISNNLINITTPYVSFTDTIYEMPYDKERCYNEYYGITASYDIDTESFIDNENRCGIVDIGLATETLVFVTHDNKIKLNTTYYSYFSIDGTPLYKDDDTYDVLFYGTITDRKLRDVPKNSINPYIALKSGKEYTFDFSELKSTIKFETIIEEYQIEDIDSDTNIIHRVFYNDSLEVIVENNILTILIDPNIDPTLIIVFDKENKFFGKTLKMSSINLIGYSIIKMGALLNSNSYKLNYVIEKYDKESPYIVNTSTKINKFNFNLIPNDLEFYYFSKPNKKKKKIYKIIEESNNIIFYELDETTLPGEIIYKKVNDNNIHIKNEDVIAFDLNHYSNNGKVFNLNIDTNVEIIDNESFNPKLNLNNDGLYTLNLYIRNDIYDITSSHYDITNDIIEFNTLKIDDVIDVYFSLDVSNGEYSINYNLNIGPRLTFSFGRLYNLKLDNIVNDHNINNDEFTCVLSLSDTNYNINNLSKTFNGVDCITGVSYDGSEYTYTKFVYDNALNKYVINLKLNKNYETQYFLIDLRNELQYINFDSLSLIMYMKNNISGKNYNVNNVFLHLNNFCVNINGNKIQDDLFKDNSISMFYTDSFSSNNIVHNINETVFLTQSNNLKKVRLYDDGYYDYSNAKNIYKVTFDNLDTLNLDNINNKIILKKMTGRDRDIIKGNENIYLNYYHTYYIYFTELLDSTKLDFIVSLYLDENYNIPVNTENIKYVYQDDKIIGYKIDVTKKLPTTIYYCIKLNLNNQDIIIKGGTININLLNIVKINKKKIGLIDENCHYKINYINNDDIENKLLYLKCFLSRNNENMTEIFFNNTSLYLNENILNNFDAVKSKSFNFTFKQINEIMLNYNKIIKENIKGLDYEDIIIISNKINDNNIYPIIVNNDIKYENNVYLSSKKKYILNLNDESNYNNGYFIINCVNNIIDLTKIIEIKEVDYTLTKNKLIFKGSSVLQNNYINFNVDKFKLMDLYDYLEFYYEFLPMNKLKVFINGEDDDNLNLKTSNQFKLIENIKNNNNNNNVNNNIFDSTNNYLHLEKINNSIINNNKNNASLKQFEYKLLHSRISEDIDTNNFNIIKHLKSLQDKNHLYFNYVKYYENKRIEDISSDIDNYNYDDKYIIEYDLSLSNKFTLYKNILYKFSNFDTNKNYYTYDESNRHILTQNEKILLKFKEHFIYVYFMENFNYNEIYYGDDLNFKEKTFIIKENQYDINVHNLVYHTITNKNNTFLLEEAKDLSKRIIAIKIKEGRYTLNELLSNIEKEMNNNSPFGFIYKITNNNNLKIKIVDEIYNNIYIKKRINNDDMLISTKNKNLSNFINEPLINERSLKIGNKYKIYYEYDDINIYKDIEKNILFNSNVIKDDINKIIYFTVDEYTPKLLYIGIPDKYHLINIYNYDNIIKFNYNVEEGSFTTDENIDVLNENEYYLFDYSSFDNLHEIKFYTNNTLTTEINIGHKDINNKTILLHAKKNMNGLFYAVNNNNSKELFVTDKKNNYGFRFRSDLKSINDDLIKDNKIEIYNNIKYIPTNTSIVVKRPQQLILSQKFIEYNKIYNKETNYSLFLYVDSNDKIYTVIKKYDNYTNNFIELTSTKQLIGTKPNNTIIIYVSRLYNTTNDDNVNNNIFNFKFLISYDDDESSFYTVVNVDYVHNLEPDIILSLSNDILNKKSTDIRVNNDIKGDEPKSIKNINTIYNNKFSIFVYDLNNDTINLIIYENGVDTEDLIFTNTNITINNNLLSSYFSDDDVLRQYYNNFLTISNVNSIINNEINLVYAVRYRSSSNIYSTYFIKVIYNSNNNNDNLEIKHINGIYSYSNVNDEGCMVSYNDNIIWTGKNYMNSDDDFYSNIDFNLNISMYIINIGNVITITSKNDNLFNFPDNDTTNSFSDSIYATHVNKTSNIICVHAHYDNENKNNNFINLKTLNIDNFGDIKIINNININNDEYITDKNYNNILNVKKSNNNLYKKIYGLDDANMYSNINNFFSYADYSSYVLHIYTPTSSEQHYNLIKYVYLNSILIENGEFSLDKGYLGIPDNNKLSYPINNLIFMKGNKLKNKHVSTDKENLNIIDNLKIEIINDYNNLQFYKNRVKSLNNVISSLGYYTDGSDYLNLYREVININNNLFNKVLKSTSIVEDYEQQLKSLTSNANFINRLKDEEAKYNLILNELLEANNNYNNYLNDFNQLMESILSIGSNDDVKYISYYAKNYIDISKNVNDIKISSEEKNETINYYISNKNTINYNYYKNNNEISNNYNNIFKRESMLNKYLLNLNTNLINEFKKPEFNKNNIVYYQNVNIKNRKIFINSRRFKIFLTASIVDKTDITNYLQF